MRVTIALSLALLSTSALAQSAPDTSDVQPARATSRLARLLLPAEAADPLVQLGAVTRYVHFGAQIAQAALLRGNGGDARAKAVGKSWVPLMSWLTGLNPETHRLVVSVAQALADGTDGGLDGLMAPPAPRTTADHQFTLGVWIGVAHLGSRLPDELQSQLVAGGRALSVDSELDVAQQQATREAADALARHDDAALAEAVDRLLSVIR